MSKRLRSLPGILAFSCLAPLAVAPAAGRQGLAPEGAPAEGQDLAGEMLELFRRVERNLQGIDRTAGRSCPTSTEEGSSDGPVQYRDWIDAYYRRLGRSGR
jgi:hypothetical protein